MNLETSKVFSNALELAPQDRQRLAESLWDSLEMEAGLPAATDSDLANETSQRRAEILSGEVSTISHSELKHQLGR
jgi:putative addiction module component (TIGR02574 family)